MLVAFGLNETQSVIISIVHLIRELKLTIAVRYGRVLDHDVIRLNDVPPIGVLLEAKCVANGANLNIREHHVTRVRHNVGPERRVVQAKIRYRSTMESDCGKQNRSLYSLVGVKQIPPRLAITLESTASVDVDVFAAK